MRFQLAQVLNALHRLAERQSRAAAAPARGRERVEALPAASDRPSAAATSTARRRRRAANAAAATRFDAAVLPLGLRRSRRRRAGAAPLDAATYRFPYSDASFDVVFSPSVFTHLLRRPLENYLAESCRVMRPGATALLWFFVLDERARSALTTQPMSLPARAPRAEYHDDVSFALKAAPEAMIAFNLSFIKGALVKAGFERRSIRVLWGSWRAPPGSGNAVPPPPAWTGTPVPHTEAQDVILARKAARRPG